MNASVRWNSGTVRSFWIISDDQQSFSFNVSVPSQSKANVVIPLFDYSNFKVTESGAIVWTNNQFVPGASGVVSASLSRDAITFSVLSGNYRFKISNGKSSTLICGSTMEFSALRLACPDPNQVTFILLFST